MGAAMRWKWICACYSVHMYVSDVMVVEFSFACTCACYSVHMYVSDAMGVEFSCACTCACYSVHMYVSMGVELSFACTCACFSVHMYVSWRYGGRVVFCMYMCLLQCTYVCVWRYGGQSSLRILTQENALRNCSYSHGWKDHFSRKMPGMQLYVYVCI